MGAGVTWEEVTWAGVTWEEVTWEGVTWEGVTWEGVTWEGVEGVTRAVLVVPRAREENGVTNWLDFESHPSSKTTTPCRTTAVPVVTVATVATVATARTL